MTEKKVLNHVYLHKATKKSVRFQLRTVLTLNSEIPNEQVSILFGNELQEMFMLLKLLDEGGKYYTDY